MRLSLSTLVVMLAVPACGGATPTEPASTTPTIVTEVFSGTMTTGGSSFYSFAVSQAGTVSVMLASIISGSGQPLATVVRLGVGVPSGTGCGVTTTVNATPALASQITNVMSAGTYCVELSDAGSVTDSVNFSVRIVHP